MSSGEKRLKRLYSALSGQERARAMLINWKAGREVDLTLIPELAYGQIPEYCRLTAIIKAANDGPAHYIVVIALVVEQLGIRFRWLRSMRLWGLQARLALGYLTFGCKQPITETEYRRRAEETRAALRPLPELVEELVFDEKNKARKERDRRAVAKRRRVEMLQLFEQGVLTGKRKGTQVWINEGSFCDWRGEPVSVLSEFGEDYDVFPDDQGEEVDRLRAAREQVMRVLRGAPLGLTDGLDLGAAITDETSMDAHANALIDSLEAGLVSSWSELRAAKLVLDEASTELDGESVLDPNVQALLDEATERMLRLHAGMQEFRQFELREPTDEHIARVRTLMEVGEY